MIGEKILLEIGEKAVDEILKALILDTNLDDITYILHIAAGTDQCRCEIMLCGIFIAGTGGEGPPRKAACAVLWRWKNTEAHDVRPEDRG